MYRVIWSILLFMIVYLVLVVLATLVAVAFGWLGVQLMLAVHNFWVIVFGLGLITAGVSVVIFLVKFIFSVSKDENAQRVEIREQEQPRLFAFIRDLTIATGTSFPKKIFLSPDTNAGVFYNSSFWSMFLPIRKNLDIGLGLVNSVNVSEFKAVMAHEFGHFSQRSMKLGSFTYNVNRVIHNMLYDNRGYTDFLNSWGRIHGALALLAKMTAKIAQGIQWVLRHMYGFINKRYMGLSREMEFHADAVAAGVAGGNNLVSALSRIEIAGSCYNTALGEANARVKQNKVSRNIFSNQLTIFRAVAAEYGLPLTQGLPAISYHFVTSFSRSRINFKNQWASHPTLQERKQHLDSVHLEKPADDTSAWSLFDDAAVLQEKATARLYQPVKFDGQVEHYDPQQFEREYMGRKSEYALPAEYKGYYDGRYIETRDWDLDNAREAPTLRFEDLFNEETAQLQSSINSNKKDVETARAIKEKKIPVKSFDFDGVKYAARDAEQVARQLETEIAAQLERQRKMDKDAFLYFLHRPGASFENILTNYRRWQQSQRLYDAYVQLVNRLLQKIRPVYQGGLTMDGVWSILAGLKEDERDLKRKYRELEEAGILTKGDEKALYDRVQVFLDRDYAYFIDKTFQNDELDELKALAIDVANAFNRFQFKWYKKMLVEQLKPSASTPAGDLRATSISHRS